MQEKQEGPLPLNRVDYLVIGLIAIGLLTGTLFVLLSYFEFQRLDLEYDHYLKPLGEAAHMISNSLKSPSRSLFLAFPILCMGILSVMVWSFFALRPSFARPRSPQLAGSSQNKHTLSGDLSSRIFGGVELTIAPAMGMLAQDLAKIQDFYREMSPLIPELDSQAAEAWKQFYQMNNALLIGFASLCIAITGLIFWTAYRIWQMPALMKRLREA
jgi:hypothetical protein